MTYHPNDDVEDALRTYRAAPEGTVPLPPPRPREPSARMCGCPRCGGPIVTVPWAGSTVRCHPNLLRGWPTQDAPAGHRGEIVTLHPIGGIPKPVRLDPSGPFEGRRPHRCPARQHGRGR